MTSGLRGSAYAPGEEVTFRLRKWRHLAGLGWTLREIAAELDVPPTTLARCIQRARKHGHPDAVVRATTRRM